MILKWISLVIYCAIVCGCSHSPSADMDRIAGSWGFQREQITGQGFKHVIYRNTQEQQSQTLHVYLEGDGSPWINHTLPSDDPTPRNPLMLKLMALDQGPAVYLARPCYNGMRQDRLCTKEIWTSGRYSRPVITSMITALNRYLDTHAYTHVILVGHSGGGTIAMLMAQEMSGIRGVITLAANLDIVSWAALHNYSPLYTSLNPLTGPPLDLDVFQLHLAAENDSVIPPSMLQRALENQLGAELRVLPGFDHACCWAEIWPDILCDISARYPDNK